MIPYWLLFLYFTAGVLLARGPTDEVRRGNQPMIIFGGLIVAVMVGLRYRVGTDWENYENLFFAARHLSLGELLRIGDPGYQFVSWVAQAVGADLWFVDLVCAVIFAWGLTRFAQAQPDPWLAYLVAVPYLIIVVAMGYTRQAVAIGSIMAGLAQLQQGKSVLRFSLYVFLAALFHRTAVLVLPLVLLASERNRILNAILVLSAGYTLYNLFLAGAADIFVRNYVKAEYNSQGAAIRIAMNLMAATLFLVFRKRLRFTPFEERIWRDFSYAAFAFLALLLVLPSSTAVDRLALYLIPLQIAVLSRFSFLGERAPVAAVVAYSAMIQFTWLTFSDYALDWIPYRFWPLT